MLQPMDVFDCIEHVQQRVTTTILDPWYNKGVGGARDDYDEWLSSLVRAAANISQHLFVWGFPQIVHRVLDSLPPDYELVAWLTWYYKNCPSVVRGWRSSQNTCLHLAHTSATLHPENFLNDVQQQKLEQGKMRFIPGPSTVVEVPLNVGFVGKHEQTGHPAQKPIKVFEPLVLMTTVEGDTVLDPMCGSGTTAVVCQKLNRRAVLCDISEEYIRITEERLGMRRGPIK